MITSIDTPTRSAANILEALMSTAEHAHKVILLAAQFLQARDTMRRFFGDRYPARVGPYRHTLAAVAAGSHRDVLDVGKEMMTHLQERGFNGVEQALLLAAIVEEVEAPTPLADVRRGLAEEVSNGAAGSPSDPGAGGLPGGAS